MQSQDDGSTTGTVTAQFSELVSSDNGQYTCVLDVQDDNTVTTFRRSLNVTVQGKIVYSIRAQNDKMSTAVHCRY